MPQGITQELTTDRLDLTDLLEVSDLLLGSQTFRLRVAGWSMTPALRRGDWITVEPVAPTQLQIGDLVLFHLHGRLLCHRLIAVQETGTGLRLITKGDATSARDAPLQPEQVLGRVTSVKPGRSWARALFRWSESRGGRRLRDGIARGLQTLQGLRPYRWIMRTLLSRWVAFYIGIPEGRRWFRYHRITGSSCPGAPVRPPGFHLVAKLAGTCVGSARVEAGAEGLRLQTLYVRIPYRGLGIASHLLTLTAKTASQHGAPALLASVEPANTAALRLLAKMRFHPTGRRADGLLLLGKPC